MGLDAETLDASLAALREFASRRLSDEVLLGLDARDEFPAELIREMYGADLGIHLFFIPERYNGMGAGAFDLYRICEALAGIDLGIATGVLATFLGSEPLRVGGTPEQQAHWMTRIADEGLLMAYAATEPAAPGTLQVVPTVSGGRSFHGRPLAAGTRPWGTHRPGRVPQRGLVL